MSNDINKVYSFCIEQEFNNHIDEIKDIILEGFDDLANVNNTNSEFNLNNFKDKFIEVLNKFNFIEASDYVVSLNTPDIENFDFSGLALLHQVLEGTVGTYLELSQEDVELLNVVVVGNAIVIDQKNYYLVEYQDDIVRRALDMFNKELNIFPFSNTPPLHDVLFGKAINYVNNNFDAWVKLAVAESAKLIK